MSRRINSLENIRTPSPCEADWDSMLGGERVRFCEHCARGVHDLSAMTRKDALRLVRESEGRLCVRFVTLPDGRVKTLAPRGGLHQIGRRASRVAAGAFGAALTLAPASAAHAASQRAPASPDFAARLSARADARPAELAGSGASVAGTVVDPNGAVVAGVVLVLTDEGTNERHNAATNEEGYYRIAGLGAGSYTLTATVTGFKTLTLAGIALREGGEERLDITVEIDGVMTMGIIAVVAPEEPLVKAASEDDLGEVVRLLDGGADVRVRDRQTNSTALDEAVGRGNLKMVRALLAAGADPRARSKTGLTPLMRLDSDGSHAIVRALVERGADVNARDDGGDTPLGFAARNENPAVLRALIEAGAHLDATNEDGRTALMFASEAGAVENVRALVAAGADVFHKDEEEKTALSYALENDREEVAALLRERGAVE